MEDEEQERQQPNGCLCVRCNDPDGVRWTLWTLLVYYGLGLLGGVARSVDVGLNTVDGVVAVAVPAVLIASVLWVHHDHSLCFRRPGGTGHSRTCCCEDPVGRKWTVWWLGVGFLARAVLSIVPTLSTQSGAVSLVVAVLALSALVWTLFAHHQRTLCFRRIQRG